MNVYTAYHLCIHSEIPLLETMATTGAADVTVRLGGLEAIARDSVDGGQQFLGYMPGSGKFLIRAGEEIIIDPDPETSMEALRAIVLGPAMSVILRQRGRLVLHASAVVIEDRAIAFMGGSGWGKSTLANAFHQAGHALLTDDVLAVNLQTTPPLIYPAFPQQRLWSTAATALGHQVTDLAPLHDQTPKLAYGCDLGFCQEPRPLHHLYVLAKGPEHSITPLTPQTAFTEITRHTRGVAILKTPEFVSSHLHQCTQLLKTTPVFRFTRKPSLADLPTLVAMVKAHLEAVNQDALVAG
jgi:hypothetical protein